MSEFSDAVVETKVEEDEVDETLSEPDEVDENSDPVEVDDELDEVVEFLLGENESPAEVLAPLHGDAAVSLAAARDLDGYDGPTYNLVDQEGNIIEALRADRPFGFELAEGQSIVSND